MKYPLLILLTILLIPACDNTGSLPYPGDTVFKYEGLEIVEADQTGIDQDQLDAYRQDAEVLAVRYVNERDSTKVILPDNLIDVFYHGLLHIYNSDAEGVGKVTDEYQIHARQVGISRRLLVTFDDDQGWTGAWRNGETLTGNESIDHLIVTYQLQLDEYHPWGSLSWDGATLKSEKPLNHFALADLFEQLNETRYASPDAIFTDGNDIETSISTGYVDVVFSLGWGDCPAGCINRHYWEYRVFGDGTVILREEYGDG